MSYAPPASPSIPQARAESTGYLALTYVDKRLLLQIRHSAAGYFIGTADESGPISRESFEYFRSHQAASHALTTGRWHQRRYP